MLDSDKKDLHKNKYATLTALAVDDHPPMLKVMKGMLVAMGFKKVLTAYNGQSALAIMEQYSIDIVVSDWNMPKMNGLELLQALKKNEQYANTPFIMLTANLNQEDVIQAVHSGVSEYIIKPFNNRMFQSKINRAFSSPAPKSKLNLSIKEKKINNELKSQTKIKHVTRSILIVDDEPSNITVLTELLKDKYNLQACLSGQKALEICSQEKLPDLILLDIMMPLMNGITVCQQLKENPLTEHIPIIFISALSQTKDVVKGLSIGAVDYITKPINPEITLARISNHIEQIKQREDIVLQLDTMIENMRLKEDIERVIHHDLKNPLAVILAAADVLKEHQSYSQTDVDLIIKSADTIKEMINQQMLIHQLESESNQHENSAINALELFNQIAYSQKEKCEQYNVLVQYSIPKHIKFLGSQRLSFNMFNNLISNAIEASPEEGEVHISVEESKGNVFFHIHNLGLIPEEIQIRFFDKFITHGKQGGTGLGTYSAKLSALTQGGDIDFSTNEQIGTTLTVRLLVAP